MITIPTKHIFDECRIYPWDVIDWIEEGQTEYGSCLDLRYSDITHLPSGMYVDGYLNLVCTAITELPTGLKVHTNLYIQDTNITRLPDDITVIGDVYIRGGSASISDNPKPGGVKGRLVLT